MTAARLTNNEVTLAKKFESIQKPYFIVRAKFDLDLICEKNDRLKEIKNKMIEEKKDQKQIDEIKIDDIEIDEEELMNGIKMSYADALKGGETDKGTDKGKISDRNRDVFLIDNNQRNKWDFPRLVKAMKDKLPSSKKESLTLSSEPDSEESLKDQIDFLKGKLNFQFKIIVLCISNSFKYMGHLLKLRSILLWVKTCAVDTNMASVPRRELKKPQRFIYKCADDTKRFSSLKCSKKPKLST